METQGWEWTYLAGHVPAQEQLKGDTLLQLVVHLINKQTMLFASVKKDMQVNSILYGRY